jgi:hypothetical protein
MPEGCQTTSTYHRMSGMQMFDQVMIIASRNIAELYLMTNEGQQGISLPPVIIACQECRCLVM